MRVRCKRCNTTFQAKVEPYPGKFYDKTGNKRIRCPTCGVAYFHFNEGTDADGRVGWLADRPLEILK